MLSRRSNISASLPKKQNSVVLRLLLILFVFSPAVNVCLCRTAQAQKQIVIDNLVPRKDTSGQILDAHDGSLQYFHGRFYLYGTHYGRTDGLGKTNYFVSYSSKDLAQWKNEGRLVLSLPVGIYYRPHVQYNQRSKLYVLWYNVGKGYGVATSKKPRGPFTIVDPDVRLSYSEHGVGDFDFFVDDDGQGYIAYTTYLDRPHEHQAVALPQHHMILVERLTPDYLATTSENSGLLAGNVEAPALFRKGGLVYLLFDNTCAFCPNGSGARVYTASSPLGPYTYQNNINLSPSSQSDGQSWTVPGKGRQDVVLPAQQLGVAAIPTVSGTLFMWMGDRWGSTPDGIKGHDFQVWEPLKFEGSKLLPLQNFPRWGIDLKKP